MVEHAICVEFAVSLCEFVSVRSLYVAFGLMRLGVFIFGSWRFCVGYQ